MRIASKLLMSVYHDVATSNRMLIKRVVLEVLDVLSALGWISVHTLTGSDNIKYLYGCSHAPSCHLTLGVAKYAVL